MAEAQYGAMVEPDEPPQQPVDSDILPDDVVPEAGLEIFDNLNKGNLIDLLNKRIASGKVRYRAADTIALQQEAEQTMKPWRTKYGKAMGLATLTPEAAEKNFPFPKASNVMLPFLTEAMLDFHARTTPELVWAKQIVNMHTYGTATPEKEDRARRVGDFMNYQITETIPRWRSDQDKLLLLLPAVGTAYKKTFFCGDRGEVKSELYLGDKIVFNQDYPHFDDAPDKFIPLKYTRNEVVGFIRGDAQWQMNEDELPTREQQKEDFKFSVAFSWIDLDGDGLDEPYEIIIWDEHEKVVALYPAYDEEGIFTNDDGQIVRVEMADMFTQYRFLPDPEGGPMGLGWGIMLCDMFDTLNTSVRQLMDAGTLANLAGNSGLIDSQMAPAGRGNRQQAGPISVRMGELTPVTAGNKPLGQSVVQFPYSGPNTTLFQLTEWMLEQVRGMTNSALNMDTNSQEAAVMYLARLQQGLKVPNSIVMRVYDCAREEFKKIAALNYKHYSDKKYNVVLDVTPAASMRADFNPEDCDIRPAIDPSQGSDIERMQRANLILQEAKEQQQPILNTREAYLDWLAVLRVEDVERLAPVPSGEPDPMEQLMKMNMAREAELAERDMKIREAKQKMEQAQAMLKSMKEGAQMGLEYDQSEADIALTYANAFKALWEIGMAGDDPVATVQNMETRLIDRDDAPAPPIPLESPEPNPQPQGNTAPAA